MVNVGHKGREDGDGSIGEEFPKWHRPKELEKKIAPLQKENG
jgi:hypothetical protein